MYQLSTFAFFFLAFSFIHILGFMAWIQHPSYFVPKWKKSSRILGVILLCLSLIPFFFHRLFPKWLDEDWSSWFLYSTSLLQGFIHVSTVFGLCLKGIERFRVKHAAIPFISMMIWFMPIVATIYGRLPFQYTPPISYQILHSPLIPPEFDQLKIGVITDLHLGPISRETTVQHVVENLKKESPDLVFFLGDLIESDPSHIERLLQQLFQYAAPKGQYFVWGNHEFIHHARPKMLNIFQEHKVKVLENEEYVIDINGKKLIIGGIQDRAGAQFDHVPISWDSIGQKTGDFKIFLSHRPDSFEEACQRGYHLQLSGHTHGGQLYPMRWLVLWYYGPKSSGWYHLGECRLYVSQGTGFYGPPLRLGTKSELTMLTLQSAPPPSKD